MKHFIIVKFNNSINTRDLVEPIKKIFNEALEIEGVSKVEIHISNSDRPNRHDLMIEMGLTKSALDKFDSSEIHKQWKDEYSKYITSKTIFDCE